MVRGYVRQINRKVLLEEMKRYKKLNFSDCENEAFERKKYFYELDLEGVRSKFRIVNQMVETVRGNFPNKYRHSTLQCQSCKDITTDRQTEIQDSQAHLLQVCPAFSDLRGQFNLNSDAGIIGFFKAVIDHRIENGEV